MKRTAATNAKAAPSSGGREHSRSPTSELYDDYVAFKGWEGEPRDDRPEDHASLIKFAGKHGRFRLLDVGFGRGELLDWAKAQGIETYGSEIIPELVSRALDRGHAAVGGDLSQLPAGAFDVVTALDVLEHLSLEQLQQLLTQVRRLLAPDGVFLARFPNGQSPFSIPYQNGDLTHVRWLTPGAVRQVAASAGLSLCGAHNLRPIPRGFSGFKHRLAYALRDLTEIVLGYAYFGHRFPMDPNVVVVLRAA